MAAGDVRNASTKRARPQTTDDTPTVVSALTYASVPDLTLVGVLITGVAQRTDAPGLGAFYIHHRARARRYDADGTDPGLVVLSGADDTLNVTVGAGTYAIAVIVSTNDLQVQITGDPGETLRWILKVEYELVEETVDVAAA
jgi:hypothetical protein